jgi:hypothetical protein
MAYVKTVQINVNRFLVRLYENGLCENRSNQRKYRIRRVIVMEEICRFLDPRSIDPFFLM